MDVLDLIIKAIVIIALFVVGCAFLHKGYELYGIATLLLVGQVIEHCRIDGLYDEINGGK